MNNRHKRDDNHKEIVEQLRQLGYSVADISQVDGGVGDILVGKANRTWLFEIKRPGETKLTQDEKKFRDRWKGQWAIVTSIEEAMEITLMNEGKRPTHPKAKPCYNYRSGFNCVYGWRLRCSGCQYKQGVKI